MDSISFQKFTGAGNDFIIIDGFKLSASDIESIILDIPKLCARGTGVGADGLIIILKDNEYDFQMRYFNSDGSEAEMCGNGGRCVSMFAFREGYTKENMKFRAISGIYSAEIIGEAVKLQMQNSEYPIENEIQISNFRVKGYFLITGVPHFVIFQNENPDLNPDEINTWAKEIRFHKEFSPAGTNVNILNIIDKNNLVIRTYERGVEEETLACGTGSTASGIISTVIGVTESPVNLKTKSGLTLTVELKLEKHKITDVFLTGEARLVYKGTFSIA